MAKFMNLTPHEVVVYDAGGKVVASIPPSGQVARVKVAPTVVDEFEVGGSIIPLRTNEFGDIEGLPKAEWGTFFIVSQLAAAAAARIGRVYDIVVPDDAVRDADGRIIGCRAFATHRPKDFFDFRLGK